MVEGAAANNWALQAEEIESLGYIYPEEMTVLKEQPYSLEVIINSNTYPDCVPYYRLKNLSPDYMDNRFIDRCETMLREKCEELIGSMMIFELCDMI